MTNWKPKLSLCCDGSVRVHTSEDELGSTRFYVCEVCGKACDIKPYDPLQEEINARIEAREKPFETWKDRFELLHYHFRNNTGYEEVVQFIEKELENKKNDLE